MTSSGRFSGKAALVTGAASGFGLEIARRFAREGAKVAALDLNGEGAIRAAEGIGADALAVECDVSLKEQVGKAVSEVHSAFGRLDVVVNNAGISHRNMPMLEVDEESFDRVYAVNVKSIYLMSLFAVPLMRKQGGGVIINVTSTAGLSPRAGLTWYNGSKGAANLLTKSMAIELAPDGIRVNAVAPVLGVTPLLETFIGKPDTPENRAKFLSTIPLGRLSEPSDVASAALNLASDESDFLTGVILPVDGGRCI